VVHGLSDEFLMDKPRFAEVAEELIAFIGEAPLVAHNASFDLSFINAEFERAGREAIARERMIDTLLLARRKHPGSPNRLDDLCARYSIDNSRRVKHGALLDAEILAEVYLELIGGRQAQLILVESGNDSAAARATVIRPRPMALLPRLTEEDRTAHAAFLASLGDHAIWRDYVRAGS
jgi:DNA polymerase-3 subunit epsilon